MLTENKSFITGMLFKKRKPDQNQTENQTLACAILKSLFNPTERIL
jgi:hypothetical protein